MLATGGSALAALTRLREAGASDLRLVCLVAAPEGVEHVRGAMPDIPIVVAALDRQLDEQRLHPARARRRGRPDLRHRVSEPTASSSISTARWSTPARRSSAA